jgi:hypothetical protein
MDRATCRCQVQRHVSSVVHPSAATEGSLLFFGRADCGYSKKLGEVAGEFDRIHSVDRALRVGALDRIISPAMLRPYLIGAVERGTGGLKITEPEKVEGKSSDSVGTAA